MAYAVVVNPEIPLIKSSSAIKSVASAIVSYRDITIPPSNTFWSYSRSWWARLRNKLGYTLLERIVQPVVKASVQVLTGESYKINAVRLQDDIANAGGVSSAASLIERVLSTP